jgi:hypothetical protein
VSAIDERSQTGEGDVPWRSMFWNVVDAEARKRTEVDASMVSVPVVLAAALKRIDWLLSPAPLLFVIVRLLKALEPVIVPANVCIADDVA